MKLLKKLAAVALAVAAACTMALPAFAADTAYIARWEANLYDANYKYVRAIDLPNPETRNGKTFDRSEFNGTFDSVIDILHGMGYSNDSYNFNYYNNYFDGVVYQDNAVVTIEVQMKSNYGNDTIEKELSKYTDGNDIAMRQECAYYNAQHNTSLTVEQYYNLKYYGSAYAAAPAAAASAPAAAAAAPTKTHKQQLDENAAYEAAIRALQAQIAANEAAYAKAMKG